MPKISEVPASQLEEVEPFTFVWRDKGSGLLKWAIETRYGFGVLDAHEIQHRAERGDYVALTVREMEELLPLAVNDGPSEKRRYVFVPLTVLSEGVDADPSKWLPPIGFELYGLEIVNGKLVKKQQHST